jgi:hypothetical protein
MLQTMKAILLVVLISKEMEFILIKKGINFLATIYRLVRVIMTFMQIAKKYSTSQIIILSKKHSVQMYLS